MNILSNKYLLLLLMFFLAYSCKTPLTEITYLNGIKTNETYKNGPKPEEYTIRPNDQLYIQVISDDPTNSAFLNLSGSQTTSSSGADKELITYLVDEQGKIDYLYMGEIHVSGLKTGEVRDIIQKEVDKYLETASVFVKLVNRNITVLGEVNNPGQQMMVKNELTIFEALGTAGDLTDWGNRKNVKLIRETPEGKYIAELDLTNPEIIYSPNYYILPHDIVYVEHSTKVYGRKGLDYMAPITITASLLSLALIVVTLFGL